MKRTYAILLFTAVFLAATMMARAQQIEKLELVLTSPIYNTDRGSGLSYEARGDVHAKSTALTCLPLGPENQPDSYKTRLGTYRISVAFGDPGEHIATYLVKLNDGRSLFWQGYFKIDPLEDGSEVSWAYEGVILRQSGAILTDYTPLSRQCFGGRLTVFFLNQ